MKSPILSALIFVALVPPSFALSEKGNEAVKRLETAMLEEVKTQKPKEGQEGYARENYRAVMLPRIKALLASPDNGQLAENLAQLTAAFTSEAVQKSATELQDVLRLEREALEKTNIEEITKLLERAGEVVKQAKTPSDLDEIISELGKNRQRGDRGQISEKTRAAYSQIEPTLQFATNWQNYLAAKASGNSQLASSALQNITGNSSGPYLIPRSQILALLQPEKNSDESSSETPQVSIEKVLADIKSLADIEKALSQLRELQKGRRNFNGNDPLNSMMQNLQPLDKTYQEFKAGLAVSLDLAFNYNNQAELGNALLSRLRSELFLLVLPRYVGAPEGTAAKPGEDVPHFLERLVAEAKARGDMNLSVRSRDALRLMQRGTTFTSQDSNGLAAFVSGQNQETAGQFLMAVMSYQNALKSGSDLVPSKLIGERLDQIQAAHPKEYEAAMERIFNPPVQRDFNRPPFFPNDPRQQPTPPPSLLIPPAPISSPTQTPQASPASSPAASVSPTK